jgi:cold shock CspA family protein
MPSGTVTAFDDQKGWGTITEPDGTERFFHCTQIAGGTRTIAAGTSVRFALLPRLGRHEATAVTPT